MLKQEFFLEIQYYKDSNSFGDFILDKNLMKNVTIPRIINKKIAFNELKIVKNIFDKYKITFFLTHGSCLGAIREKDFIDYDSDIDIGCYKKDLQAITLAIKELKNKYSFKVTKISLQDESIAIIKNNVVIDISLYKSIGNFWQSNKSNIFHIPYKFLEQLDEIEFLGIKLHVPYEVEEYLEYQYGRDWRTPIKDYYSPYRQKIELPIQALFRPIVGLKISIYISKNISNFIKILRAKFYA